ncbi:unnamed protein product [Linum tenue]|uniref:Uncharacterized protein n=1 Tax=Linum tenue TaxID=586396 RepID=A0AAV0M6D1_9ROSI|nr:unnamed protein product [Linum tenue]
MEDFERKVSLADDSMETDGVTKSSNSSQTLLLLRRFLQIQQRRAQAYATLKRCRRIGRYRGLR